MFTFNRRRSVFLSVAALAASAAPALGPATSTRGQQHPTDRSYITAAHFDGALEHAHL